MRFNFCAALFLLSVTVAGADASLLSKILPVWGRQPGSNPINNMTQGPSVAGASSNNLTLALNAGFDGITITGQVTYTWTLTGAIGVTFLEVGNDEFEAYAVVDQNFTTGASGF